MAGRSGYPKISGRVFRVFKISGSENCNPKFARNNQNPKIRVPDISGSGSGLPGQPELRRRGVGAGGSTQRKASAMVCRVRVRRRERKARHGRCVERSAYRASPVLSSTARGGVDGGDGRWPPPLPGPRPDLASSPPHPPPPCSPSRPPVTPPQSRRRAAGRASPRRHDGRRRGAAARVE